MCTLCNDFIGCTLIAVPKKKDRKESAYGLAVITYSSQSHPHPLVAHSSLCARMCFFVSVFLCACVHVWVSPLLLSVVWKCSRERQREKTKASKQTQQRQGHMSVLLPRSFNITRLLWIVTFCLLQCMQNINLHISINYIFQCSWYRRLKIEPSKHPRVSPC